MRSDVTVSLLVLGSGLLLVLGATVYERRFHGFDALGALMWIGIGWLLTAAGGLALVTSVLLAAFRGAPPTSPRPPNR